MTKSEYIFEKIAKADLNKVRKLVEPAAAAVEEVVKTTAKKGRKAGSKLKQVTEDTIFGRPTFEGNMSAKEIAAVPTKGGIVDRVSRNLTLDSAKEHLKNNWGWYAGGAGAAVGTKVLLD